MAKFSELLAAAGITSAAAAATTDADAETTDTNSDAPKADAAALSAAEAKGRDAGIAAERKRWGDVLGSEEGGKNVALAISLLVADGGKLGAEAIVTVLKSQATAPAATTTDTDTGADADAGGDRQTQTMADRLSNQQNPDTGRGKAADLGAEERKKIREAALKAGNRGARKSGKKG